MLIILKDLFSNSDFKNSEVKLFAGNWFICKENIFSRYTFFSFFFKSPRFFLILKKCDIHDMCDIIEHVSWSFGVLG